MNDRDRLAPVTLTGEYPVSQLIICLSGSKLFLFQPVNDLFLCFGYFQSVQESGVYHFACGNVCKSFLLYVFAAGYYFNDRKIEFFCKFPVTGIMSRYCHNSACSIAHQYIVGNPDGNFFSVYRIDCTDAVDLNTCLVFCKLRTLKIRFSGCLLLIFTDGIHVFDLVFVFFQRRMLRRNYHIGCTEKSVRSGGVYRKLVFFACNGKINLCALALADPVFLRNLYTFNVIYIVKAFQKLFCIICDLQHPLAFYLADNRRTAAFADTVDNLLVCKTYLTRSTPVNRHFTFISKSCLKQFQEDPLCPFVVFRICGVYFSVPVKGISQRMKLFFESLYVICSYDLRMDLILDGIVLCRKTKSIPAHWIENIVALHSSFSRHNIKSCIRSRMTYVKSLS